VGSSFKQPTGLGAEPQARVRRIGRQADEPTLTQKCVDLGGGNRWEQILLQAPKNSSTSSCADARTSQPRSRPYKSKNARTTA
jgi:hypothetical protein